MRIVAGVAIVVVLVAGALLLGRVSDNATLAMGLTAAWFGIVFAAAAAIAWSRRELLLPLALGFGLVAVAATLLIGLPTLRDKEVSESVVMASAPMPMQGEEKPAKPRGNVAVSSGRFVSLAHEGSGVATVVRLQGGERKLTLTRFGTDSGPDLRLYLATKDPADGGGLGAIRDLGPLKGNRGDQQYSVPRGLDLDRYRAVVVWCRAFSVGFTSAKLG